ncbi:MAG TPA: polysaccharide biosynthesis protein [Porphyromonadaceae bacterium]|nr:oligosaccharide flippase family protein [Paramuribaculum sp.]HAB40520.1 polysaccharide biosynthesis protein [Porphyromonadaceae bacterium]
MGSIKSLAKDTAIYGLSSIVGRFINWCLVPLYTVMFSTAEYGVVTYIYSITALALIIFTYGMETGFFRFANPRGDSPDGTDADPTVVYSTSLISLAVSSSAFFALVLVFLGPVTGLLHCPGHPSFAWLMAATVALDAFTAIPFAYLRYSNKALRFAALKLLNIGINITLNIFFILICPWLYAQAPETVSWFFDPAYGIGYIFLSNFAASAITLVTLLPELTGFRWRFDAALLRRMLAYSAPLLVLGVAGIMNQTLDKILLPYLVADKATAMQQLGIYGANYKIAIVMVMFIQAFRFAYEPFIFSQNRSKGTDKLAVYAMAMKWFVIFAMAIFLFVMFYLDFLRYFISPRYFSGLKVVPVVMIAEFFFGVFFNLSLWYKLTDQTRWGMWFSLIGLAMTILLNILLVPRMGYMGCAWAALGCYGTMMVASYLIGRAKYPIDYGVERLGFYFVLAMALYFFANAVTLPSQWINIPLRTLLLATYIGAAIKIEGVTLSQLLPLDRLSRNK